MTVIPASVKGQDQAESSFSSISPARGQTGEGTPRHQPWCQQTSRHCNVKLSRLRLQPTCMRDLLPCCLITNHSRSRLMSCTFIDCPMCSLLCIVRTVLVSNIEAEVALRVRPECEALSTSLQITHACPECASGSLCKKFRVLKIILTPPAGQPKQMPNVRATNVALNLDLFISLDE